MKKPENLSHHEQLRLDYLYKNYYYLNDKEKKEFDYLRQKSKGIGGSASVPDHEEQQHTVSDAYEQEPVEMDSSGLSPKYPERSSRSRREKKASEALAGAGLGQETNSALGRDFPAYGLGGHDFYVCQRLDDSS